MPEGLDFLSKCFDQRMKFIVFFFLFNIVFNLEVKHLKTIHRIEINEKRRKE